ncbi:MAG TPA: hypothetical protein VFI09_06125 [Solirubrobacterales bacterium]|nr:hypothetical protein [Solirubrobacterales bacterium]
MEVLEALGIARLFWPRLVAVLVAACLYFAPHFSAAVIEQAVKEREAQITSLLNHAFRSAIVGSRQHHSKSKVSGRHRTGAPTGARAGIERRR